MRSHNERVAEYADRYRGLRGVVRYVLPRVREYTPGVLGRNPCLTLHVRPGASYGRCLWCGLPAVNPRSNRPIRWHPGCAKWYAVARGKTAYYAADGLVDWVLARQPCHCGAAGSELDHIVAIGVAARQGVREYVRAFDPDRNLQWLCHAHHATKTAEDRRTMARMDAPEHWAERDRREAIARLHDRAQTRMLT